MMKSVEEKVDFELNQMVYSLSLAASIVLALMGIIIIWFFNKESNILFLSVVGPILVLVPTYRTILISKYLSQKKNLPTSFWIKRFYISTSIIGLSWGVSFFYFFTTGSVIDKIFILVLAASIMAAGAFLYGPLIKTALVYMVFNTLPVSIALFIDESLQFKVLGVFSLFYIGILLQGCWIYYKKTKASFRLQLEKDELVKKVNLQNKQILKEQSKTIHSSRLAALGEMSAGMAHEINNPMTVILAAAKAIEKKYDDKEALEKNIQRLKTNSDRVIKIINSLRKFSRVDDAMIFEDSSIEKIVTETLDLCEANIVSNGIKVNTIFPEEDIQISCNEIQISQVILNIINNAKDAILEENLPEKKYHIDIEVKKENDVHIIISNNGPAIPEELLIRVFEPFYTSKEVGKGTGLGLSLSKGIVEAHHGKLSVYVKKDETFFEIVFPS